MPDKRSHRGPHPEDASLFAPSVLPTLRAGAADYLWLLNRGYPDASSLKLVGDRFRLTRRQRTAISRSICADEARRYRRSKKVTGEQLAGCTLLLDGFNLLVTIEAALGGGVLLGGRDESIRDMSSLHGTYRKTAETGLALSLIGRAVEDLKLSNCRWLFDQPVSNSGRVVAETHRVAEENGWAWEATTVPDPDRELIGANDPIVSADSIVLDGCERWFNLARLVIEKSIPDAWMIDFAEPVL